MKNLVKVNIALLMILMLNTAVFGQLPDNWKWLNPNPQGNSLFAIDFPDNNIGYSVGAFGTIIKTSDAGNSWDQLNSNTQLTLLSVDFINSDEGYAGGFSQLLKKTTDGGIVWSDIQLPREGQFDSLFSIMDIEFVNSNTGYALGFFQLESKIWKTIDGGVTWSTQTTAGANYLNTLHFLDENNGYAAGGSLGSEIIKTTDGGLSWELVQFYDYSALSDIYFLNPNKGIAAGENGCILMSTDSGLNWIQTGSPSSMDITTILFINANTGFGFGSGNIYLKTVNGGLNWTEENYGWSTYRSFMDAVVNEEGKIHAAGLYGILMKSDIGGVNWETPNTVTENTLSEIDFIDNNTGYAVCGYGAGDILKTTDAGETWVSQITSYHTPMYGIRFTDAETGYIAGSIDIKKTTNGGTNWINVYSSTQNEIFTDVDFTNPNTGFVIGSYGVLKKTTDAGQNWTSANITSGGSILTSICFVNENTGYAVGDFGAIVRTTDAGATWTSQTSPFTMAYLTSVDFTDVNTGYISSGAGLLKTTNGGDEWLIMNAPSGGYYKVQFRNEFGYAVASNGKIIKSIDAGLNWIEQPTVTNNGLYALYFNSDNYVYSGGTRGTILKTIPAELIVTGTSTSYTEISKSYKLKQNYPNPFNPVTKIEFSLPKNDFVSLKVFDITGKEITSLVNENLNPGEYKINFNGAGLNSGVYFYILKAGDFVQTRKMILLK